MRNSARRRSFRMFLLEEGSDCSGLPGCRGGPAFSRKFGIITLFKQKTKRSAQVACHLGLPQTRAFLKKGNTRQSSLTEDLSGICFRTWTLASWSEHGERERRVLRDLRTCNRQVKQRTLFIKSITDGPASDTCNMRLMVLGMIY